MCMRKKLSAIINTPDLPSGFTECEYLENSNVYQRLTLPFSMTWDTKVKLVAKQVADVSCDPVGAYTGNDENDYRYEIWISMYSGAACSVVYGKGSLRNNDITKQRYANRKKTITVTPPTFTISAEGTPTSPEPSGTYTLRYTEQGWSIPAPTYVFGSRSYGFSFRVYSLELDNGVQKMNVIPVLDANGKPCMYDKISRQCFYNSGTGTFKYKIKAAW